MTRRENLMGCLGHTAHERVPCAAHISNAANLPSHIPARLSVEPLDLLEISRFISEDLLYEIPHGEFKHSGAASCSESREGNELVSVIETSRGNLRSRSRISRIELPASPPPGEGYVSFGPIETSTVTEYFIKSRKDYQSYCSFFEDRTPALHDDIEAAVGRVGEEGVVAAPAPCTPFYSLVSSAAGIERIAFDLHDYPGVVEEAMERMHRKNLEFYGRLENTPVGIIRITEDLDAKLVSPGMFARYSVPALKEYTRICHESGKLVMLHMCGHIREFLPHIADSGVDAVHCLCPPPVGNTPIRLARSGLGKDVAVMARMPPDTLLHGSVEEVREKVKSMLEEASPGNNFMVILPCGRAPLDRLKTVVDTVNEYGKIPTASHAD